MSAGEESVFSAMTPTEAAYAVVLANKILDRPSGDPDDDLAVLARQLIRTRSWAANVACNASQLLDVVKAEWGTAWSPWDQEIRDSLSTISGWGQST